MTRGQLWAKPEKKRMVRSKGSGIWGSRARLRTESCNEAEGQEKAGRGQENLLIDCGEAGRGLEK